MKLELSMQAPMTEGSDPGTSGAEADSEAITSGFYSAQTPSNSGVARRRHHAHPHLSLSPTFSNSSSLRLVRSGSLNSFRGGYETCFDADTPSQFRKRHIQIQVVDRRYKEPSWMHPNIGGEAQHLNGPSQEEVDQIKSEINQRKKNLSEWPSTAISGNDILSSVLFTSGLTASKAGKFAPLVQLFVCIVIYCFRFIFEEVMSAVPLNGGCYNALLNSSSKRIASIAAIFSILSYVATGVVCGVTAFYYLNTLIEIPIAFCTVGMLFGFALLCLIGIVESAFVALVFFIFHALTLTILCITSLMYAIQNPSILIENMKTNLPQIDIFVVANGGTSGTGGNDVNGGSEQLFFDKNNFFSALFFGFGPALLGVTGFESSTQFIEQQAPGIFPKTLRNMWFCSSLYNMAFACLSLAVVPLEEIYQQKNILLSFMGRRTGGKWLEIFVSIDAFIVLSGAVLTSYIGIIGLVERLAIDRILPRFLIQKNTWRQTNHFIILSYFLIASSLVLILNAKVEPLAGVFGFAFLGVLASFAISCLFLQIFRSQMPRQTKNSWTNCFFCLFSVLTGLVSNMLGDFLALAYSFFYFLLFGMIMVFMFERVSLLKGLLYLSRQIVLWRRQEKVVSDDNDPHYHEKEHEEEEEDKKEEEEHKQQQQTSRNVVHGQRYRCGGCGNSGGDDRKFIGSVMLAKSIERIKRTPIIFLCKLPNLPRVNEAISYVMQNEQTYSLRLVHIVEDQEIGIPLEFEEIVCLFDHIFPSIKIDFVSINGRLEPAMIEWISKLMQIPTNMMFMGQPSHVSTHEIAAMGVRVITG